MTPEQCIANAETILLLATKNLDGVAANMSNRPVTEADAIAYGVAQVQLAGTWANLGETKALMDPFRVVDP